MGRGRLPELSHMSSLLGRPASANHVIEGTGELGVVVLEQLAQPLSSSPRHGQHRADCGQQRPVSGLWPGTWGLPAADGQVTAKDEELQVITASTVVDVLVDLNMLSVRWHRIGEQTCDGAVRSDG